MWEGRKSLENDRGLSHLNLVQRFWAVTLPLFVATVGLVGLFGIVDIKPSAAQGLIWYVTPDGSGTSCMDVSPCLLQTAVNQATDGDDVFVASGTYTTTDSQVLLLTKSITLTGGYDSGDWAALPDSQNNRTILDGEDSAQVVRITGVVSPVIEGFEIRNGSASEGAGIYNAAGGPIIRNNQIYDNTGDGGNSTGAGIYDLGSATIENNAIHHNTAGATGGGIHVHLNNGLTTISFNEIYSNTANASHGGGIFVHVNSQAFIEGNSIHHNNANDGAGFGTIGTTSTVLQNNFFYQNRATDDGGGIFALGTVNIWNNTIAANDATTNGGGIFVGDGATVQISNTIVVSNTGGGVRGIRKDGATGTISGDYNNIFGNGVPSDPTFTSTIAAPPDFINFSTFNLRLKSTSPNVNAGDPDTSGAINQDIDGQVRPNPDGNRADIGADEYYSSVPAFTLSPDLISNSFVNRGETAVYTHTLENIGTVDDEYNISCTINRALWNVTCPPTATLASGQLASLQTSIDVPAGESGLAVGRTTMTATSVASPSIFKVVVIESTVAPQPGVAFTPNYTATLLPGEMVTFTHLITNTGDSLDTFNITVDSDPGSWANILPAGPFSLTLASGASTNVRVVVTVPDRAAAGLENVAVIEAASDFNPQILATVANTVTAKATIGTRYVATSGEDLNNNCTQSNDPCATIRHAVGQASQTDEILIRTGTYAEDEISINDTIHLSGGWKNNFREQDEPGTTIIVPNGSTRLFAVSAASIQPTISNLTIDGGNGGLRGGAIQIGNGSQTELTSLILQNNQAGIGGAVYIGTNAFVTISNTHFLTNTAVTAVSTGGGALYNDGGVVLMQKSTFVNNEATFHDGGAIYMDNGQLTSLNNLFYNNRANRDGGAIFSADGIVDDDHNSYVLNEAGTSGTGGAIYNNLADLDINSSIIVSNTASVHAGVYDNSGTAAITYSDLWGNSTTPDTNVTNVSNNISEDPLFTDEQFHLGLGSPAIDTANPDSVLTEDFEGDFRPSDQGFDMGYDELPGCIAKRDDELFGSIQAAIDMPDASSNLILVTGICRGVNTIEVNNETISQTVHITETLTIQGGWNNDFSKQTFEETIIDAEGQGRGIFVSGGSSVQPVIETITIMNGDATGLAGGPADEDAGGNIYNLDANPQFIGVKVVTGTAVIGGGIYNHTGTFSMTAFFQDKEPEVIRPELAGNTATDGGAIYAGGGLLAIDAPFIHENTAVNGAGLFASSGTISVTNAILANNIASGNGGAIYNDSITTTLLHMTVYSNTATGNGGGIYNAADGSPSFRNNIFESNKAASGPAIYVDAGTPDVDFNYYHDQINPDLVGITQGSNSVESTTAPGLLDPANNDFHLAEGAAAIDIGDPDSIVPGDFEDDPRPSNQSTDIGADEVAGCRVSLNGTIYGSIQAAITDASNGDVIDVSGICSGVHEYDTQLGAGTCRGDNGIIFTTIHIDKNITLRGGWDEDFKNQNDVTILDALSLGRVIYIAPGFSPTIEQFDILQGSLTGTNANGAGICIDQASPIIRNNNIYSNTATNGAGIYSYESTPLIESGNRIYSNDATNSGGGIAIEATAAVVTATIQNNFVYSNTAVSDGGAFYNISGDNYYWHNTVVGNEADMGGALYIEADSPEIRGNLIVNNSAATTGGAHGAGGSSAAISYNNFFGQTGGNFGGTIANGGTGSQTLDPEFADETYAIQITSPIIDLGDPTMPITQDYEADIRPSHQGFDLGADEVGGCEAYNGNDPDTIYGSLQLAIDLANAGDTIYVEGTCYGVNSRTVGVTTVVQNTFISKSLTIDGLEKATLDALGNGRVIYVDNSATVTLANMTLQNGDSDTPNVGFNNNGGGIYNTGTLILDTVEVISNTAAFGGGIYNTATISLTGNTIKENTATDGAGFYNNSGGGYAAITNENMFQNNVASQDGGAVFQSNGDLTLDGNSLFDNDAGDDGGAIYLTGGTANTIHVQNNFIIRNTATTGGGIYNNNTDGRILHNTLYRNTATTDIGGGISSQTNSITFRSNIVDANNGSGIDAPSGTDSDYNNVIDNLGGDYSGGVAIGASDIMTQPDYIGISEDDYHLEDNSAGVDIADPSSPLTSDFDGDLRPTNGGPDIGADEINSCLINVEDEIFGVLQDAIDYAEGFVDPNPTIKVARGECRGVLERNGTYQVGYVSEDLEFIGSLKRSNFSDPNDYYNDSVGAISTIFNADDEGRVIFIEPNLDVSFTQIAFINGDASANSGDGNGGGIYNAGSSTVSFSLTPICQNTAINGGGYYGGSNSTTDVTGTRIGRCVVAQVTESAGGSVQDVDYFIFDGNTATGNGGGLFSSGRFDLRNVSFYWNIANNGGGLYNSGNNNRGINATFYTNTATTNGGGVYNSGSSLSLYHNTLAENTAKNEGGAIWHNGDSSFVLNSSIVYSNTATVDGGGISSDSGQRAYNIFYQNVPNDTPNNIFGSNTLQQDPLLNGTFLSIHSPAIDAANPQLLDPGVTGTPPVNDIVIDFDRQNHTRPDGGTNHNGLHGKASDIGSDEYYKEFGCRITPGSDTKTAVPGQTVTYTFNIENYGAKDSFGILRGYTDTISITLETSQGWGILQDDTPQTVTLGWGDTVDRIITVTVPTTATTGLQDISKIRCQSGSMPNRTDSGNATTNVGLVAGVIVTPDYIDTALPGDVITYVHEVKNQGNEEGRFELSSNAGPQHANASLVDDFGTVLTDTYVTLQPGESITVLLRVNILTTAAANDLATPGVVATEVNDKGEIITSPQINTGASLNEIQIGFAPGTRHVATLGAADTTNCTDPAFPCKTIQYALNQSVENDTILISTGTYTDTVTQTLGVSVTEQIAFIDKSITIQGGYNVADGFISYEPITNAVTLDGNNLNRIFFITDSITVTLSSLFIENGNAINQDIEPTKGGALYNLNANLTISGTWFISNSAKFGGAIYHQTGDFLAYNSAFASNGTKSGGGQGGAIYLESGSNDVVNNTFANNALTLSEIPDGLGGAIYANSGSLDLYNNIFAYNEGDPTAPTIFANTPSVTTLNNDYNLYAQEIQQTNFVTGTNRVIGDPLFSDAYYHISTNSPAKDNGTAAWVGTIGSDYELDSRPQPQGGAVDIGADERVQRPGFVFEPVSQTAVITSGERYTYTHVITNTGDENDSYTLTMDNQSTPGGGGFAYALSPTQTGTIAPGTSVTVTFVITGGLPGYVEQTVITATSGTSISLQVVDTSTVTQTAGVDIEASKSGTQSPGQAITYSHTLTNTGDGIDSFTILPITATAVPTGWLVTVSLTQTGLLNPNETLPFTVTVNVPPGTLSDTVHTIGIEAVATAPFASDILTNTTTVDAAYGISLTPDNSSTASDDTQVVYTHTLQNLGNLVDEVQLSYSSSPNWSVDVQPMTATLQPLETETIVVTVTVPANTGGLTHTAVITAESEGGLQVSATNTTTVDIIRGVLLEPDSLIIDDAGQTVTHTHTLTNTSNVTDTFDITSDSSSTWTVAVEPASIEVGPGMTETVTATVTIDGLATPPDEDVTVITATSQITSSVFDLVTATTRIRQVHGLQFEPDNLGLTDSGTDVVYTHTLTNTGNGLDSYNLVAISNRGWPITLPQTPITVSAGISANVIVTLTVPVGGSGLVDTMHVTATSTISPDASAMVTNTTFVTGFPGTITVTIAPDNSTNGQPNDTITYSHVVTNSGDITETFSLDTVSSSGWTTAVSPTNLLLNPLESVPVTVTVTIPPSASNGETDVVTVTVRSDTDADQFDTALDATTVGQTFGVQIKPDNADTVDAGTVVTYSHIVTNTGNGSDTFAISASSSNGWTTNVPNNITLASGISETIVVSLTVPSGAAGLSDAMIVTATSTTDGSAVDTATDTTTVNGSAATLGVDISSNGSESSDVGTIVNYTFTIENTGSGTDDFTITAVSNQGWTVLLSSEQITLNSGETTNISLRVSVPGSATGGTVDTTTVTVRSDTDTAVFDQATATTTVNQSEMLVYLPMVMKSGGTTPTPTPTPSPTPTQTPTTCSPTSIDLIVTEIRVEPFVPAAGETATIFVTLRNQGSTDVAYGNNFYLDLYDNRLPASLTAGDLSWGVQGDDLNAGTSKTYTASYVFTGGSHELYARADTDNTVDECPNENNNTFGPVTILVTGSFNNNQFTNQSSPVGPRSTPTPFISEPAAITPTPIPQEEE